jgi:hypothetical protein
MSINQIHQFLSKDNIQILWDVLIEEPIVKQYCNCHERIIELTKIYEINLKGFYDIERKNHNNLIELNKKYIILIINYLNNQIKSSSQIIPHPTTQVQQFKKITITDEQIKQPITYEEIQNERKTQFEKDLYTRQQEFSNAMTQAVPPIPDFSDKIDKPISQIELEIIKIKEQRNYDMELINKNYQDNINTPKTINNSISYDSKNNKHISWADTNPEIQPDSSDFFTKLKKVDQPSTNTNSSINIQDQQNISFSEDLIYLKKEVNNLNNKLNLLVEKIDKIVKQ